MHGISMRTNPWKITVVLTSLLFVWYLIIKPTEVVYSEEDIVKILGSYMPLRGDVIESVKNNQAERIKNIRNVCNYSSPPSLTTDNIKHLMKDNNVLVDEKHKTLYCYLPKVGCTSWKVKLVHSTGLAGEEVFNTHPSIVDTTEGLIKYGIYPLSQYSPDQMKYRIQKYFKFLFVRHPMERVLSAYRSKWEKRQDNIEEQKYFYGTFYDEIVDIARRNKTDRISMISFQEFTDYIIHKAMRNEVMEHHWERYYKLCHMCIIDYDFVGKFDTLVDDVAFVLRKISSRPEDHYFPNVSTPRSAVTLLEKYYGQLSNSVIDKLETVYSNDIKLFGYNFNSVRH